MTDIIKPNEKDHKIAELEAKLRLAEQNLARANSETNTWRSRALNAEHRVTELENGRTSLALISGLVGAGLGYGASRLSSD